MFGFIKSLVASIKSVFTKVEVVEEVEVAPHKDLSAEVALKMIYEEASRVERLFNRGVIDEQSIELHAATTFFIHSKRGINKTWCSMKSLSWDIAHCGGKKYELLDGYDYVAETAVAKAELPEGIDADMVEEAVITHRVREDGNSDMFVVFRNGDRMIAGHGGLADGKKYIVLAHKATDAEFAEAISVYGTKIGDIINDAAGAWINGNGGNVYGRDVEEAEA